MLHIITLHTIDKIFEEAEKQISAASKMIYINCLMHHFREKSATVVNAVAFEIFKNDLKNYDKFVKNFEELHKAGLVIVSHERITFQNMWGQHIDRTKLDKVNPMHFVGSFEFSLASTYKDEMLNSQSLIELLQMKHRLSKQHFIKLLELFVKEQDTFESKYKSYGECTKHFTFWLNNNIDKLPKDTVKSSAKLLGGANG